MNRMTTTGVLKRLGEQTNGLATADDFIALPCSHPDCCSITYFVKGDDGLFASIPRLLGEDQLRANLSLAGNRIAFPQANEVIQAALTGMMSETTTVSRPELVDYILNLCEHCDIGLTGLVKTAGNLIMKRESPVETVAKRMKRITVKSFMDSWTMNMERLQQCCVHVGSVDPDSEVVRIPFCARQAFGALRHRTSMGQVSAQQLISLDQVK